MTHAVIGEHVERRQACSGTTPASRPRSQASPELRPRRIMQGSFPRAALYAMQARWAGGISHRPFFTLRVGFRRHPTQQGDDRMSIERRMDFSAFGGGALADRP